MWSSAMDLVVPEGDGGVNEMHLDAAMSNVWPVRSIVSRREEGKRPKELWRWRPSGSERMRRFAAK
jgi:hypothetical protein